MLMTIKATLIDKRGLHYLQNPNQKRKKKNSNVKEIPPTFDMFYLKFKKYFVNRFYHNAHKNEDSKAHLQLHKTYSFVKSISFPKTDLLDLVFLPLHGYWVALCFHNWRDFSPHMACFLSSVCLPPPNGHPTKWHKIQSKQGDAKYRPRKWKKEIILLFGLYICSLKEIFSVQVKVGFYIIHIIYVCDHLIQNPFQK